MIRTPAQLVLEKIGSTKEVADVIGVHPSNVTRWFKEKNGTGGFIPTRHLAKIYQELKRRKLKISAEDLILGKEVDGRHYRWRG